MPLQTPPGVLVLRSHAYSVLRRFLIRRILSTYIRNLYTFNSSWWITCICLLLPWVIFARNPFPKSTTCGCETSMLVVCQVTICLQLEELATNHFHWLKNVYVAVSNWTRAVPFFFCPIGEIFSFPMCWCVCGSRCLSVKIFYVNA